MSQICDDYIPWPANRRQLLHYCMIYAFLGLAQFGDLPKEELEALRTKKTEELFLKALKNEPQIKLVLGGCMMEMIEAGILQVEI